MATQDNDASIAFGNTTAQIALPAKWGIYSASTGGTLYLRKVMADFVDGDGNTITGANLASGNAVDIPVGDLDLMPDAWRLRGRG